MKKILLTLTLLFFWVLSNGQDQEVINYKELQKLIPANLAGFSGNGDPDGSTMSMNGMSFSSAERRYKKGDKDLSVTIVDYHGAATMYSSAAMAWTMNMQYEDDESKIEAFNEGDFNGIIEIMKKEAQTRLIGGYKNRYFVEIDLDGTNNKQTVLDILKALNINRLP